MRCADAFDFATELTERERAAAVETHRKMQAARSLNETGRCVDCDEAIDPRRLTADPMASRCMPCQRDVERRAKAHR